MGLLHKKQQNTKIIPLVSYPLEVRHQMCVNKSHTSTNCIKNHHIKPKLSAIKPYLCQIIFKSHCTIKGANGIVWTCALRYGSVLMICRSKKCDINH